jgi:hypothetical protein
MDWTDNGSGWGQLAGTYKCDNEPSISIQCGSLQLFTVDIKIVCMACELLLWYVTLLL